VEIRDLTPTVRKLTELRAAGRRDKVAEALPKERVYPISPEIARRLFR
jgi:hypothetical protein